MNIVVEQSVYPLANLGDIAMLQVALSRLRMLWPNANIKVLTSNPERLFRYCPGVLPLNIIGRDAFTYPLVGLLNKHLSAQNVKRIESIERSLLFSIPRIVYCLRKIKARNSERELSALVDFWDSLVAADLVIATGGGYICDEFPLSVIQVLTTLGIAQSLGKATAIVGQGLGPLENPSLKKFAAKVIPALDLICLRESIEGARCLRELKVVKPRVIITGDDAVQMAYDARTTENSDPVSLGVNLRVSAYSGVTAETSKKIRDVIQRLASELKSPILGLPVSFYSSDPETIESLIAGYAGASNAGTDIDTPDKLIARVGECRMVITGSYHAAVFALSQGIPVVSLAQSEYYRCKFEGLSDQFGGGCEIVTVDSINFTDDLYAAAQKSWEAFKSNRAQLLSAASEQIERGRQASEVLYDITMKRID